MQECCLSHTAVLQFKLSLADSDSHILLYFLIATAFSQLMLMAYFIDYNYTETPRSVGLTAYCSVSDLALVDVILVKNFEIALIFVICVNR